MRGEEERLEKAVVRLNARLLGIVLGFQMGLGLFLATNITVLKGGRLIGRHLSLLAQFFPGSRMTFLSSLIRFCYGIAVGHVIGAVIGVVYNKVAQA